jgi:electron transfer flavoprotein beta subunit
MKAKKKPLEVTDLGALGVTVEAHIKVVKWESPAQRQKGVILKDVSELVDALKKKGLL